MMVVRIELERGRAVDAETLERLGSRSTFRSSSISVGTQSQDVADAGHLAMQELVLRLGRALASSRSSSWPRGRPEPWRSIDVAFADAAVAGSRSWSNAGTRSAMSAPPARSSRRKVAELERARGRAGGDGMGAARASGSSATRLAIGGSLRRYPEVFATPFPGSSTSLGRGADDRRRRPGRAGARLVRPRGDADVCVARRSHASRVAAASPATRLPQTA